MKIPADWNPPTVVSSGMLQGWRRPSEWCWLLELPQVVSTETFKAAGHPPSRPCTFTQFMDLYRDYPEDSTGTKTQSPHEVLTTNAEDEIDVVSLAGCSQGTHNSPFEPTEIWWKDIFDVNDFIKSPPVVTTTTTAEIISGSPSEKDTNPKDVVGSKKTPISCVPAPVISEVGVAMLEGKQKYGGHNFRKIGVRASVYYDATWRHLSQWWEGENIDEESGLNHVTKAIATLVVLRDAMIQENLVDDRPPKTKDGWLKELNKTAARVVDRYADRKPHHYTQVEDG